MERGLFAEVVLGRLDALGIADVEYDPAKFSVRQGDGRNIYLGNLFHECEGAPESDRERMIDRFLEAMTGSEITPDDWAAARPLLRPVLRPATYGIDDGAALSLLSRPALPFVSEFVVLDLPRTRAYVSLDRVREWNIDPAEVFAVARANLATVARPGVPDPSKFVRFIDTGDSYFGSWLLVPGWLASYAGDGHRPVAFIPDDDTLLIVPDDPDLLAKVYESVEEQYRESARHISPQGYTVDEHGTVVPLDELPAHPARTRALRARAGLAATEYVAQTRFLTAKLDSDLDLLPFSDIEPAYVAPVDFRNTASGPATTTVCGAGVEYLLPETDYVYFVRRDDEGEIDLICTVPFDAVVEILGLVPVPGLHPPRFELRRWPDDAALARLRERAVTL
ncbi:hypothetical protein ACIP5Y_20435 [Nocardia sp. NPDC088792]|uniref:hypothetical protein n=1 Tax=Nocardia sp. NPDC088792 TaxID=3364332 RepID=UPI0037FCF608